jgi:hypothetical protein
MAVLMGICLAVWPFSCLLAFDAVLGAVRLQSICPNTYGNGLEIVQVWRCGRRRRPCFGAGVAAGPAHRAGGGRALALRLAVAPVLRGAAALPGAGGGPRG